MATALVAGSTRASAAWPPSSVHQTEPSGAQAMAGPDLFHKFLGGRRGAYAVEDILRS